MPVFKSGPVLRNILDRSKIDVRERDRIERDMCSHVAMAKSPIAREYTGPFKEIDLRDIVEWRGNNRIYDGYSLYFTYGGVRMVERVAKDDEILLHGISAELSESHKTTVKGQKLSDVIQHDNTLSEFWSGEEIIHSVIKDNGKTYLMFEVQGLSKRYF